MIELLAPVGSKEALVAAVESGADAVYLAGKMFGARAYAANFENDELCEAVLFAHKRNVSVDVAVNTIVDNSEFEELADYLRFLYKAGADAIIVQDLGVAKLAQEIVPALSLHASTQLTVHNLEGVKFMESLGFTRVVLSRELSLADIAFICENTKVEIEVFIHGALCICYSGQCLMSGMIGGRSGNRGRCAQPCRLPYTLVDRDGCDLLKDADYGEYLLSPKDMNTIEMMPELIAAGVASFKIEGRMKRSEYVAVVVDTYRRRIDACLTNTELTAVTNQDKKDLAQIFNRDFTEAYLKVKPGKLMMSDRRPNNRGVLAGRVLDYDLKKGQVKIKLAEDLFINDIVEFWVKVGGRVSTTITEMTVKGNKTDRALANEEVSFSIPSPVKNHDRVFKVFDAKLMEKARSFFQTGSPIKRFEVDVSVVAKIGEPLRIKMIDQDGFSGEAATDFIAEQAMKRPLTEESIRKQIERLGTTAFILRELQCLIDGEVMVPVSEINEARRKAVEMLEKARMKCYERPPLPEKKNDFYRKLIRVNPRVKAIQPELCVSVDSMSKVEAALSNGADVILFGGESFSHETISAGEYCAVYELVKNKGKKIMFNTPRIMKQWQVDGFKNLLAEFKGLSLDGISVHNVAEIYLVSAVTDAVIHADTSLNVYNSVALHYLKSMGVGGVTLSPELNFTQIERIAGNSDVLLECVVQGNLELMVSEHCTIGSYLGDLGSGKCSQPCRKAQYWLRDRKEERFPLVMDQYCRMHVLNGKELCMLPHVPRFGEAGIKRIRIEGKWMDAKTVAHWTKLYREFIAFGNDHPLVIQDKLDKVEPENMTRGHYFRGVL